MIDPQSIQQRFVEQFGREPVGVVAAPGRVNLIGEHTDYNDGFVLPIAIERTTAAAFAPREDSIVRLVSVQADESAEIDFAGQLVAGKPAWANYSIGVAAGLVERGAAVTGADILFDSDVPLGGGLSSSASLEVATAMALLGGTKGDIPDADLAKICQMAEHNFAGTPCGIMDQSIAIMGKGGGALLLDCRDSHTQQIPFDNPELVLLVADTQVKHELSDGGYAARRDQCYAAAAKLGVKMLRDADHDQVAAAAESLSEKERMRARHVVGEIDRTLEAVGALEAGDYERFGKLMVGSHNSLRDDYEVSCEELDAIVELACACEGVFGARMTGGGFGGCAIILVAADHADAVTQSVGDGFEKRFGHRCPIFATQAADGARRLV